MNNITIRKATAKDIDLFYPFFQLSIQEQFPHYTNNAREYVVTKDFPKAAIKNDLTKKEKNLFLAFQEKQLVGYLLTKPPHGGVGTPNWIAVSPEFQNRGIASKLLTLWEEEVLKQGGHAVQIWTTKNNVTFYKNRGYTLIGELPHAWFAIDHYLFYKQLATAKEENYLRDYLATKKTK